MSAPEPVERKETGVLRRFSVLVAMVAAVFWIGKSVLVGSVDRAAKQREYFGENTPPFGLELFEAVRLPSGDLLLSYRRSPAREARAREPVELTLIEYVSRAAVDPLFRGEMGPMGGGGGGPPMTGGAGGPSPLEQWKKDPSFAWHTTMKRGQIPWGGWSSRLRIERSFLKGGGFEEQASVDLSSKDRALVLFAKWGRDLAVDEDALKELLQAFVIVNPVD